MAEYEYEVKMTKSLEDYLETIGFLCEESNKARVIDIAHRLGVSKPSVNAAILNLAERGMVEHKHYGPIQLTPQGREKYKELKEKHERLTAFFVSLGVSPDVAEKDACAIEHVISEESFGKLKELMTRLDSR